MIRLNQDLKVGPAKSLEVYPGDKVDMEVWTHYENNSGFGTSNPTMSTLITAVAGAFGGVNGGGGEQGAIYNGVDYALMWYTFGKTGSDTQPAAYLNYILFDKNYQVQDMGWTAATGYNTQQKISIPTVNVKEAGYIFVYLTCPSEALRVGGATKANRIITCSSMISK